MKKILCLLLLCVCAFSSCTNTKKSLDGTAWVATQDGESMILEFSKSTVKMTDVEWSEVNVVPYSYDYPKVTVVFDEYWTFYLFLHDNTLASTLGIVFHRK